MKYLIFMLAFSVMAGTPRETPRKSHAQDLPIYPKIYLSWQPNYQQGFENYTTGVVNEVTVIISSPDIAIDRSLWAELFEGHTNKCCLPMTNPNMSYTAYNKLTTE